MAAPGRTSIYDFASILGVEKQKISTFILAHLTVTGNEAASSQNCHEKSVISVIASTHWVRGDLTRRVITRLLEEAVVIRPFGSSRVQRGISSFRD